MAAAAESLPVLTSMENAATNIYEIYPLGDQRWTSLVQGHPMSSVFHCTNWLSALQIAHGYDPVVVTTCPPGAPLTNGLVFCRIRSWLTGPEICIFTIFRSLRAAGKQRRGTDQPFARHEEAPGRWEMEVHRD